MYTLNNIHIDDNSIMQPELFVPYLATNRAVIITDTRVSSLYLAQLLNTLNAYDIDVITIDAGETNKNWDAVSSIIEQLHALKHDRYSTIISFGGGVIGDLSGFAAAIYMRGLRWIQMPTTLLAQVDAAVGGKTGCNHLGVKNLIGVFHQPVAVLIDVQLLVSLSQREFQAGLAEVVKYGVACDADFFNWIEEHKLQIMLRQSDTLQAMIMRCCKIKTAIVEQDPYDHNKRQILNFGHTFGHALEAATNFTHYLHGEAVAIGMLLATRLAVKLGLIEQGFLTRLSSLLTFFGLELQYDATICSTETLFGYLSSDKKRQAQQLRLILPSSIGQVKAIQNVDDEYLMDVINEYANS